MSEGCSLKLRSFIPKKFQMILAQFTVITKKKSMRFGLFPFAFGYFLLCLYISTAQAEFQLGMLSKIRAMYLYKIQNFFYCGHSGLTILHKLWYSGCNGPLLRAAHCVYWFAISLATWMPLAEAWDKEWVMPLPSPMTYRPSYLVCSCALTSTSML